MRTVFRLAALALMTALGLVVTLPGQARSNAQSASPKFEYEVATIKPNNPDNAHGVLSGVNYPADGFTAVGFTLRSLIQEALKLQNSQLSGGQAWVNSEKFDIDAKMESSVADALNKLPPAEQDFARRQMLLAILVDRLKLAFHPETKDLPVYFLVIAKNGSKLQQAKLGDTYANGVKGRGGPTGQGMSTSSNRFASSVTAQGVPLSDLTAFLARPLGRPVLDKTGLTGNFDFTLKFAIARPGPDDTLNGRPFPDSDAPFLFEAIQQQLGLKLETGKGPLEVIVIDHIERPSGN